MAREQGSFAELLTPPGAAALAVVRIAGSGIQPFLDRYFSRPALVGRPVHGQLRNEAGEVIDDSVIAVVDEGAAAEICLHGGPWVIQATLNLLRGAGFNIVDGGVEAPKPGLAVGDPGDRHQSQVARVERRVLRLLPRATTELAISALLAQVNAWTDFGKRHGIDAAAALDGALSSSQSSEFRAEMARIQADHSLRHLLFPPTVAIVGPANAGKSTLANALLGRERSIVADLPGTTRDWVGETANLGGLPILLIDTPGLRESSDAIEQSAIAIAVSKVQEADLVLLVLDATRPLQPDQQAVVDRYPNAAVVINKCDLPARLQLAGQPTIRVSARRGDGLKELVALVRQRFGIAHFDFSLPRALPRTF